MGKASNFGSCSCCIETLSLLHPDASDSVTKQYNLVLAKAGR